MFPRSTQAHAAPRTWIGGGRPFAVLGVLWAALILVTPCISAAQRPQAKPPDPRPSTLDHTLGAGEAEAEEPRRKLVKLNEYEGPFFTLRLGAGVLYDYAGYAQDDASAQQFDLTR